MENLLKNSSKLNGRLISDIECSNLAKNFPEINIAWLIDIMINFPLAECEFYLNNPFVRMRWMTPQEMVDEAKEFYPGIVAVKDGYFPVGECLIGSGDPYFVQISSPKYKLVRIPHSAVNENDRIMPERIQVIAQTVNQFFEQALR